MDLLWAYGIPTNGRLDYVGVLSGPKPVFELPRTCWTHRWTEWDLFGDGRQWCPVCGHRHFTWIRPCAGIWCDGCGALFQTRATAGDPGLVVDCIPTSFTRAHFDVPDGALFGQVLKQCFGGLNDRSSWGVVAGEVEWFDGDLYIRTPVARRTAPGAPPHLTLVRVGVSEAQLRARQETLLRLWREAASDEEREEIQGLMGVFAHAYLFPTDFGAPEAPEVNARCVVIPAEGARNPLPVQVMEGAEVRPRGYLTVAWVLNVTEAMLQAAFACPVCGTRTSEWQRPGGNLYCVRCQAEMALDIEGSLLRLTPYKTDEGESDGPYRLPEDMVFTARYTDGRLAWTQHGQQGECALQEGQSCGIEYGVCVICRKQVPVSQLAHCNLKDHWWLHRGVCPECTGILPPVADLTTCHNCREPLGENREIVYVKDGPLRGQAFHWNCPRPMRHAPSASWQQQLRLLIREGQYVFL